MYQLKFSRRFVSSRSFFSSVSVVTTAMSESCFLCLLNVSRALWLRDHSILCLLVARPDDISVSTWLGWLTIYAPLGVSQTHDVCGYVASVSVSWGLDLSCINISFQAWWELIISICVIFSWLTGKDGMVILSMVLWRELGMLPKSIGLCDQRWCCNRSSIRHTRSFTLNGKGTLAAGLNIRDHRALFSCSSQLILPS